MIIPKSKIYNLIGKRSSEVNIQSSDSITSNAIKEQEFLKLLEDSLASNDESNIIRAMNELTKMKSIKLKPLAITALKKYYPLVSPWTSTYKEICISCIEALIAINASDVCQLLYEIQARQPRLHDNIEKAVKKLCK